MSFLEVEDQFIPANPSSLVWRSLMSVVGVGFFTNKKLEGTE